MGNLSNLLVFNKRQKYYWLANTLLEQKHVVFDWPCNRYGIGEHLDFCWTIGLHVSSKILTWNRHESLASQNAENLASHHHVEQASPEKGETQPHELERLWEWGNSTNSYEWQCSSQHHGFLAHLGK